MLNGRFTLFVHALAFAFLVGCEQSVESQKSAVVDESSLHRSEEDKKTGHENTDVLAPKKLPTAREQLIAKIDAQDREGESPEIVVSLEDFFTDNNDKGSIGVNLGEDQPPISEFYRLLREIRAKPYVQDVLVRINVNSYNDPNAWPDTDAVYIISSAPTTKIEEWVSPLMPDEIYPEWMYGKPRGTPDVKTGLMPYSVWWD